MINKKTGCLIGCWMILTAALGCAGKAIHTTAPADTEVVLSFASDARSVSANSEPAKRIPADQLQALSKDLETFRLFCSHFKFQNDEKTINSIRKPALDYIRQYIDPVLRGRHQLQDDEYSRQIIALYYSKAWLYGVLGEFESARSMAARMRTDIPETMQKKIILRADQDQITIAAALQELDTLLAPRSPNTERTSAD